MLKAVVLSIILFLGNRDAFFSQDSLNRKFKRTAFA